MKHAPRVCIEREQSALQRFAHCKQLRQVVDSIEEPRCLVLEHMDRDALDASDKGLLTRPDVKLIARSVLEALECLHETGFAHTGICPWARVFQSLIQELIINIQTSNQTMSY